MSAYITINGRPLCQHTACIAGLEDSVRVASRRHAAHLISGTHCGHRSGVDALFQAKSWADEFPWYTVAVVLGSCPEEPDAPS